MIVNTLPKENLNNEPELLHRIAEGDEQAFNELFRRYHYRIYAFALKLAKVDVLAEELTQEIFVKLWEYRERLAEVDDVKAYLFKMTANHTYNYLRGLLREEAMCERLAAANRGKVADAADDLVNLHSSEKLVQEAIQKLPEQQRKVFHLSFYEGQDYEQIASQMNISPNTVRNHLVAANRSVRQYVAAKQGLLPAILLYLALQS